MRYKSMDWESRIDVFWKTANQNRTVCAALAFLAALVVLPGAMADEVTVIRPDLQKIFERNGVAGAFAALDVDGGELILVNPETARQETTSNTSGCGVH